MNKAELVKAAVADTAVSETVGKVVLDKIVDAIVLKTRSGRDVHIPGFGPFRRVKLNARKGRNIHTGAAIDIPARNKLAFKASKNVSAAMG